MHHDPHVADDALVLIAAAERQAAGEQQLAHLAVCATCQARLAQLSAADAHLRASPPDDDWTSDARLARRRTRLQHALRDAGPVGPLSRPRDMIGGALAAIAALAAAFLFSSDPSRPADTARSRIEAPPDVRVRVLPIRAITPGATVGLAADQLCRQLPWQASPIPPGVRDDVLRAYGMERVPDHEYELDYLITPELGGSPDPRNLWPEPYHSAVWNARVKDELESLLPRLVCEGKVDLREAQRDIAVDWIAAYKKYFRTDRPLRLS